MSQESQHHDVSVLSSSKDGLSYLTSNHWTLILDKASRKEYKDGESIAHLGRRTHGLYILLTGHASVRIAANASHTIGPGEVCGEISFLDDLPASADVVALGDVDALYLDRSTLQTLFELFPHLGSRFYRSLACTLSKRLRELIAPIAAPAKKS